MRVHTDAARMLVWRAGWLKDAGPADHDRDVDRQALRDRGRALVRAPRDPGPRRLGLRRRPPGRALLPRRARDHALRGHLADPEADHRARGDRASTRSMPRRRRSSASSAPARWAPASRSSRRRRARGRSCTTPTRPPCERGLAGDRGSGSRARSRRGGSSAPARPARGARPRRSTSWPPPTSSSRRRRSRSSSSASCSRRVAGIVRADCVLASNTSSLPITAIAAGVPRPRARRRHALLQPRAADEARRGRRRASTPARRRSQTRARARPRRWAST